MAGEDLYLTEQAADVLRAALEMYRRSGEVPPYDLSVTDELLTATARIASSPPQEPYFDGSRPPHATISRVELEMVTAGPVLGYDADELAVQIATGQAYARVAVVHSQMRRSRGAVAEAMRKMGKDPALILGAYWDVD